MTKEEKVKEVLTRLYKLYPKPETALEHQDAFQLLVATILSAQTTDVTVNKLTPALFEKYPDAKSMAQASAEEIMPYINKVNFYKNKAKYIQKMSQILVEKYNGEVPKDINELTTLPGVARKTANVVLGQCYGIASGIAVDTHVMRLSRLLGLTDKKDAVKIEKDLMEIVPKKNWIDWTTLLINYGREYCTAKKHDHNNCPLNDLYI